jgi:bacteriorhodopsin
MAVENWLWVGTFGMVLGVIILMIVGKQRTASEQTQSVLHWSVPAIAACSYFAMVVGQGAGVLRDSTADGGSRVFYFARYIDWAFTTPILLIGLALLAFHGIEKKWGIISGLVIADVIMIVTALFFGASIEPGIKWIWFTISCLAFIYVYYALWVQLKKENLKARPSVQKAYKSLAGSLSVIWFIYPVVIGLGTDGLGTLSPMVTTASFVILDLVAKVVFGLTATRTDAKLTDEDLSGVKVS